MSNDQDVNQAVMLDPCFAKIKTLYDYLDQQHGNAGVAKFALFLEHVREAGTACLLSGDFPVPENLKEFLNVYLHHANTFGNLTALQQFLEVKIASIPAEFQQFQGYELNPVNMTERHLDLLFNLLDEASCLGHMHCVEYLVERFSHVKIPELKLVDDSIEYHQAEQLHKFTEAKNLNGELYKRVLDHILHSPLANQASIEWTVKKYLVGLDVEVRTAELLHVIKQINASRPKMAQLLNATIEKVLAE